MAAIRRRVLSLAATGAFRNMARSRIGACIRPEGIGVIAQPPPQRFVVTVDEAEAVLMYRQ